MHGGNYPLAYKQTIQDLRQQLAEARAEAAALRAALEDILSGWQYVRHVYGDLHGVGWDRAEHKAQVALATDAGAKLLEAVMDADYLLDALRAVAVGDVAVKRIDETRSTLRELGVLKEQA